jgi:hypothetical protein
MLRVPVGIEKNPSALARELAVDDRCQRRRAFRDAAIDDQQSLGL